MQPWKLKRYLNQRNPFIIVIMKTWIPSILMVVALTACNPAVERKPKPQPTNDALIIGNQFHYGVENMLIFPVGSNYNPEVYENTQKSSESYELNLKDANAVSFCLNVSGSLWDRSASEEYLNQDENKFDIRNILFYDLKTGQTYPMIDDTLHILSFAIHKEYENPLIFYRAVKKDYNNDSIYNSKDPVMLFISDIYGRSLTQITPENEYFSDYTFYKETNTILIKTILDKDQDMAFTTFDETNFREMKIEAPSMGREIFHKSLKDSLRAQMKAI